MTLICKSLATARVKSLGLQSIPHCLCNCDTTFTRASILLDGPGASSPPGWSCRSGRRSPVQANFPGFGTTCCLGWRGDLVQERHGDHSQAARAIGSQTPMWWMANGVYCRVAQRYIAWVYSITSVCLRRGLNTIGYPERGPVFPYSATSSDRQALTIHISPLPMFN